MTSTSMSHTQGVQAFELDPAPEVVADRACYLAAGAEVFFLEGHLPA